MKQNNYTELSGHSFLKIYNRNGPPDPKTTQILNFTGSSIRNPLLLCGCVGRFLTKCVYWKVSHSHTCKPTSVHDSCKCAGKKRCGCAVEKQKQSESSALSGHDFCAKLVRICHGLLKHSDNYLCLFRHGFVIQKIKTKYLQSKLCRSVDYKNTQRFFSRASFQPHFPVL